ncbi:hypothetical protein PS925_02623 [Pseudomonas fluorescens]|uniref:Uncharacterized protein n=1 Tax=Pseudomonas fluorescens TaxID=294 RepID=A0A5E7U1K0_PSEFL|nr:hypothetical protein PS925_02623 [Pseudomonas fluorescens]
MSASRCRGEAKEAGLACCVWFSGQFDVVVDGAFGGFVEFLGFQRFN